jgi:mRNA interferase YafQ
MLTPSYAKQFERDMKLMRKRGKDLEDHKLIGNWQGRRKCHIEPDWPLIYKLESDRIVFERTGSHSDLFQK